ncbi:MAG TPA: saccharopine dehydrogenase NADP-binding domain-containing protein [Solirubrobacterales bacterium]|nr:saccharopine dehydrogenase NADP-binding domain-containing protein [Solirubrobacterales bacterium]
MSENGRELDVVVFGATGVTGRQVAAYLSGTDSRWGAAGRDPAKLERTLADVGAVPTAALAADLSDPGSLAAMAERAAVVLNLVGPYTSRARPVIEACVAAGAHYADLTGEIPFVREVVDEFDARARDAGIKLVQVCGFEALPPDLGVRLAAETARDRWGEELAEADVSVGTKGPPGIPRANDMISGGTFQSMAEMVGHPDPACLTDPAALIDDPATAQAVRARSPITLRPRIDVRGAVVGPMAPAPFINPAVIHRSAELDARERGVALQPFRYREGFALAGPSFTLPLRYGAAGALAGVQTGMRAMIRARPVVRERIATGMRKALPSSGFGPEADRLEAWKWRMDVDARTTGSHELRVRIEADGHPGYLTTARMLGEAGLMLADDEVVPGRAGCLTPATALGTAHLERFERAKLRFSVP